MVTATDICLTNDFGNNASPHLPSERAKLPSERKQALLAFWHALNTRFRWEVPLPITLGFWQWLKLGDADSRPVPRWHDGPFGRWFWELSDAQREKFLDPHGEVPPPLARTTVRLMTLSLGLKWSLWEYPDELAALIETAQKDLLGSGDPTIAGPLPVYNHPLLAGDTLSPPRLLQPVCAQPELQATSIPCTSPGKFLSLPDPHPRKIVLPQLQQRSLFEFWESQLPEPVSTQAQSQAPGKRLALPKPGRRKSTKRHPQQSLLFKID